ncbi:hypothetical protein C8F04DRAFT_972436 [Mycena alexandri]|uniref:Reverse transcriptase domain-containing protein n=1 Tax=Mycena alexandri TaxID=1745969 RepID=A0AAD6WUP4_9AGAR|nr:hypothetical protein C8F04DRAFT_972436 [Mycena alexandri]
MSYAVKFGDEHSLPFRSLIGLLTGDSASPTLWNIYFGDFRLPPHMDDVSLNGRLVSQAEQADDNLIMSTTFSALQAKVTMFFCWGTNKRTFVSANKSKWMIFGALPSVIPVLRIGDLVVELVHKFKYVGIWYTSVHANVFARHYAIKASKARSMANAIFALKHRIGTLPVREGIQMYTARVDCYLISGCELSLDTAGGLLEEHIDVQHTFLRRLLGLNSHSMLAILFTETGQMPLRIRRLLLALGRLRYMVEVGPGRVVHDAFLDSIALLREGKPGWASDLVILLRRLPTPILVDADDLLSVDSIDSIQKKVVAIVDADLQHDIDNLVKTHLLRNRLEMGENKSLVLVTRRMRHYLTMVVVPAHRKALTGLVLGDHPLSVERLRYATRYRAAVPRHLRLCRFCRGAVEDETHALFDCVQNGRLLEVREQFLQYLAVCDPNLHAYHTQIPNYDFLLRLISSRKAIKVLAKFVFNVLTLFQEFPRYSPIVFRHP